MELCGEVFFIDIIYNNSTEKYNFNKLEQRFLHLIPTLKIKKNNHFSENIEQQLIKFIDELKKEKSLYHRLSLQFEKVMKSKDESAKFIYVLDKAIPPIKSTQSNVFIIFLFLSISILLITTSIYIVERVKVWRIQNPEDYKLFIASFKHSKLPDR